jgi:hypothetical protein
VEERRGLAAGEASRDELLKGERDRWDWVSTGPRFGEVAPGDRGRVREPSDRDRPRGPGRVSDCESKGGYRDLLLAGGLKSSRSPGCLPSSKEFVLSEGANWTLISRGAPICITWPKSADPFLLWKPIGFPAYISGPGA